MENKLDFMAKKPILQLLLSMSIPMMLSMLVQSMYNIVDSIFVAQLGTEALTAVSLVFPLQNLVLSISVGFGVGICSTISVNLGAKRYDQANRAATLGVFLTCVHAVLFCIFGLFITKPFLSMFTQDIEILKMASDYSYIVLCMSFGFLLQVTMEKIFQAVGSMMVTMCLLASGCIINIILDPILIFGYFGFPAMGVKGAAIATVIGQISAFVLYIIVYKVNNHGIKISKEYLVMDKPLINKMYSIGIPSTIMLALPSILISVLNSILLQFSTIYVAVLGLYYKLQTFIYMPASGIVQGMRPIVSYNYGAHEFSRVKKIVKSSLLFIFIIMLLGTLGCVLFPNQILAIFDAEPSLLQEGSLALKIISVGFIFSSIGLVYAGVFEALGKGKESLIISLLRQFIIIIPLSYVLSSFIGPIGIWISFPISEIIASVAAVILKRREFKKLGLDN